MQAKNVGWAKENKSLGSQLDRVSFSVAGKMKRKPSPSLLLAAFFLGTLAVAQAFSLDLQELADTQGSSERSRLLDLLYRIDDYIDRPSNNRNSPVSLQPVQPRSSQYSHKELHELSKKNDMGVLPPWNEFCRMMRITNCFHSQH